MADIACKGEMAAGGATSAAAAAGKDGCASGDGGSSGSGGASRPAEQLAIGIDLGTTYSCVGVWRNGCVEIIPNKQGQRTTPSCVAFMDDGRVLVGTPAQQQAESNPRNTVCDSKRLMGRAFADPLINSDKAHWQFDVIEGDNKMAAIRVQSKGESKTLAPEQIGAMVLTELKACAEKYLDQPVTKAVITCPAYFNDAQRDATKKAGAIAGLDVLAILNEPTAAALAYGTGGDCSAEGSAVPATSAAAAGAAPHTAADGPAQKAMGGGAPQRVLVFDLGGGTFDVTLLELSPGLTGLYNVKATAGDSHLGGCDLNNLFAEWLAKQFEQQHTGKDLRSSPAAMLSLLHAVELAKCALSSQESVTIRVPGVLDGGNEWTQEVTRAQFNELATPKLRVTLEAVDKALKDGKVAKQQVDQIVLAGGSTRIPLLREMVQAHFGGKALCASINADECVAHGAAVFAAMRLGGLKTIKLKDVAPLSIGIGVKGDIIKVMIPRNTPLPVQCTAVFETSEDNQTSISFPVFEGERKLQSDCHLLGNFTVDGLSEEPKGYLKISVTLAIDRDGLLHAQWVGVGQAGSKPIDNPSRLDSAAVDKMISEAKQFAAQDAAAVARIQDRLDRLAAWDHLDRAIKSCEAFYPSIDVRGFKQWVAEHSTDGTIQTAAIEAQSKRLVDAMEAADADADAAAAMSEEEDADAEDQDEGADADGGGDDDHEVEEKVGEERGAVAQPPTKKPRLQPAEEEKEF